MPRSAAARSEHPRPIRPRFWGFAPTPREERGIDQNDYANTRNLPAFAALVEASPNFVAIATIDGRLTFLNAAARTLIGYPTGARADALLVTDLFLSDDVAYAREVIFNEVRKNARWYGPTRLRERETDLAIPVDLSFYTLYDEPHGETAIAYALIAIDVTDRLRNDQRLRALLDSGATLTNTSDVHRMLVDLAELIVRTIATLCTIDLFTEATNGTKLIERVASHHVDRQWRAANAQLATFTPTNEQHPVHAIMRAGTSTLLPVIDDAWIAANATSAFHAKLLDAMGLQSLISVPLVAGGEIVGALTCVLGTEAARRTSIPMEYDTEDLYFLEELGRRAGRSIETARLYERQRRIAETLQAASLPQSLPSSTSYAIDAEYRPGRSEATIGGDWYDAFVLTGGKVVLTVGDVLGNGLLAAVTMTKLRQAMQSAAMIEPTPNVMLDVADRTLRLHNDEGYATAMAAIYDPKAQVTTIASAGHPGPILRLPDGSIVDYESPGVLLGLRDGSDLGITAIPTPPGSLLVFFTDGLSEFTRDADEGLARIRAAMRDTAVATHEHPARAVVEAVLRGESAGDDVAVLTLRTR